MKSKYLKSATKVFLAVFLLSTFYFLFSEKILAADASALIDLNSYPWSNAKTPASFVAILYQVSLGLAAAAALGAMLYGAIWGLVLLLAAYIILYTINPGLVKLTDPILGKVDIPRTPEKPQPQPAQVGITPQGVQMASSRPEAINASILVKDGACSDQGVNTNCRLDAN